MLLPPESLSAVPAMLSTKPVSIRNRSYARWVNSGRITISYNDFDALVRGGIFWVSGTEFGHNKLGTLRYYVVKTRSLYLTWAWIGTGSWQTDRRTDGQTDRSTIASTRLALRAVVCKSVAVKTPQQLPAYWTQNHARTQIVLLRATAVPAGTAESAY